MSTAKKTPEKATETPIEETTVDYSEMNVFQKLQLARMRFLSTGVEKSGKHMKLEYKYFELQDIVPAAEQIFYEIGLLMVPIIQGDTAKARVYDTTDPEDFIDFVAPYTPIAPIVSNAGNMVTNEMQATGSSITYIRRYLWQLVLDIIECDSIDSGEHDMSVFSPSSTAPKAAKKPATPEQRSEIKKELTAASAPADVLQITALKSALKQLMELDAEQESFVQKIALKTDGFTNMTKDVCETLINSTAEMIAGYTAQEG